MNIKKAVKIYSRFDLSKFEKEIKELDLGNFWDDMVFVLSVFFGIIFVSFIISGFIVTL